jgi:hypothetical protein
MLDLSSVVIADLDIVCIAVLESEADPPLGVDRNRVLTLAIMAEGMQPIARGYPEIFEPGGQVQVFELAGGSPPDVGGESG